MEIGTIKMISNKGYGFITKEDGTDVYFHANECGDLWTREQCLIQVGSKVTFSTAESAKNLKMI